MSDPCPTCTSEHPERKLAWTDEKGDVRLMACPDPFHPEVEGAGEDEGVTLWRSLYKGDPAPGYWSGFQPDGDEAAVASMREQPDLYEVRDFIPAARLEKAEAERDALKKAKDENDGRFLVERDEARDRADQAEATVARVKAFAEQANSLLEGIGRRSMARQVLTLLNPDHSERKGGERCLCRPRDSDWKNVLDPACPVHGSERKGGDDG